MSSSELRRIIKSMADEPLFSTYVDTDAHVQNFVAVSRGFHVI